MFQPRATPTRTCCILPFNFNALILGLVAAIAFSATAFGEVKTQQDAQKLVSALKWKEGTIPLGKNIAAVKLHGGYRYLDSADTKKVLSELWGNPPMDTLGMIFPSGAGPLDESWAVVIDGFEQEGYVKDTDAEKLDAAKLLKQLQDGQADANKARRDQGYPELELVGWAVPPHYDKEAKKLYWAIDIKQVGGTRHSVNYYVRILGRRGYLVINTLGGLDQVKAIEAATPELLQMIEFQEGHRYADFDPKTDKVAAYGLVGLILGAVGLKVAAKIGLFALLFKKFGIIILALKKLWIFIIAGVAGLFNKVKGWFVKEPKSTPVPLASEATSPAPQPETATADAQTHDVPPDGQG
jgi:uncharacterized membrane-anchored protein